ncbi:otefin-like [Condylostylus longicornis]|uniref:otefin-like n=1 Tax=Condylostylus longicornis TaxID=2530218 RepID=UPI00244E563A|nr:otefin-like [Condylostylus longicornis]
MSASDDLESLDDKTLRAKCIEYGLPNVPITVTSKKILIKKLRAAMDGGANTAGKGNKARRETMHVTSTTTINVEETKPSRTSNRRTTIGAVRKEKDQNIKETAPVEKRRASRTTPVQETSIPMSLPRKTAPIITEETDFDDEFVLIDDDIKEPVVTNIPIRKSRSPSLSKSAVVTTSYKKDTANKEQKIIEEEETEEEGYVEKRKEYNLSKQFMPNRDRDTPTLSIPRYNFPSTFRVSAEKDNIYPTGYKPLYPSLNTVDNSSSSKTTYESASTITKRTYTPVSLPSASSSRRSVDLDINTNLKKSNYVEVENSDSNFDEEEEEDEIVQQAPYLSDFAKRLSNLKAEKLDIGINKKDFLSPNDNYSRTIGRRTYTRSSSQNGVGDSFRQLWIVLDRKYRIKRFLFIVMLLSAIILVAYYFYFKN